MPINHRSFAMVALDIRKAYAGLTNKVENRSFVVRVGRTLSPPNQIPAGLPQGSALSPALYGIYTADVPVGRGLETFTFADDTIISVNALQHRNIG